MHIAAWLLSVVLNVFLLVTAPQRGAAFVVKRAIIAMVAALATVVILTVTLYWTGAHPSQAFGNGLFQLTFAILVIAMVNIANVVFQGMVDSIIAFHQRYNAANLHRFPISFLIAHAQHLKIFGTTFWCLGSPLMLYGAWFDMKV